MPVPTGADSPTTPATASAPASCANCGQPLEGAFCSACGQSADDRAGMSLGQYFRESVHILTNTDSHLLRSFATLFARPGGLTAEYHEGRRARYLRPLQIFILCNAIYFVAQPLTGWNTLTTPLRIHMSGLPYSALATGMVESRLAGGAMSLEEYALVFDATIRGLASTLVILMVPLFAAALSVIFAITRRYFVEHLVFSTHLFSFLLLAVLLIQLGAPIIYWTGRSLEVSQASIAVFMDWWVFVLVVAPYLYLAIRRAYAGARIAAVIRSALAMLAILIVLQMYRLILFFATYAAT